MKQPALGVVATAGIIVISWLVIFVMGPTLFMGWASYALMCAIPFAIVVGAFWQSQQPGAVGRLGQPAKGLAYLGLAAIVAAIVSVVHWLTRGGGLVADGGPAPIAVLTIITSVVTAFFLTIVWRGWPFSLIKNKLVAGIVLLIGAYAINALIFQLMDFGVPEGTPLTALDPGGPIDAWAVVVVMVTALSVMFLTLHFDGKPFTAIASDPVRGLVWTVTCFVVGYVAYLLGTTVVGMDPWVFMVQVSIPFLFGSIVMLNMLGGSVTAKMSPVVGGLVSVVLAAIVGKLLGILYAALQNVISPGLPDDPMVASLWLANALLAVTFPFLAFFGDFFGLWPLAGKEKPVVGEAADVRV